jgi:hypothetical protein
MVRFLNGKRWVCGTFFGNKNPGDEVNDKTGTKRDKGDNRPDKSYHGRIDIEVVPETSADTPEYPFIF